MGRVIANLSRDIQIKKLKTSHEKKILEAFFEKDPKWTVRTINYLNKILKMSKSRIYKWGYERSKKSSSSSLVQTINKPIQRITFSDLFGDSKDYNGIVDWLCSEIKPKQQDLSKTEFEEYNELAAKLSIHEKPVIHQPQLKLRSLKSIEGIFLN